MYIKNGKVNKKFEILKKFKNEGGGVYSASNLFENKMTFLRIRTKYFSFPPLKVYFGKTIKTNKFHLIRFNYMLAEIKKKLRFFNSLTAVSSNGSILSRANELEN